MSSAVLWGANTAPLDMFQVLIAIGHHTVLRGSLANVTGDGLRRVQHVLGGLGS